MLEVKIALKLNELVADFMSYNNVMTIEDYDDLMLKSESEVENDE